MATIQPGANLITLINTFTVEPEHQQELIDLLIEATEQVMSKLPGYVSANIHRELDDRHVATYSQWRSQKDFDAMLRNPETQGWWSVPEGWPATSPASTRSSTRTTVND